jgi:AraC-like DNA-binding protein
MVMGGGGTPEEVAPGTLYVWRPGAPVCYGNDAKTWTTNVILVGGSRFTDLLSTLSIPVEAPLAGVTPGPMEYCLESLCTELRQESPDPMILWSFLEIWMRQVARGLCVPSGEPAVSSTILAVRTYLEEHFSEEIALEDLAQIAHLSIPHLSAKFREAYGEAPIQCCIRLRLEHARELLADPDLRVGDVARLVGYDNPFYFSRLFAKHFGAPPTRFRERIVNPSSSPCCPLQRIPLPPSRHGYACEDDAIPIKGNGLNGLQN